MTHICVSGCSTASLWVPGVSALSPVSACGRRPVMASGAGGCTPTSTAPWPHQQGPGPSALAHGTLAHTGSAQDGRAVLVSGWACSSGGSAGPLSLPLQFCFWFWLWLGRHSHSQSASRHAPWLLSLWCCQWQHSLITTPCWTHRESTTAKGTNDHSLQFQLVKDVWLWIMFQVWMKQLVNNRNQIKYTA